MNVGVIDYGVGNLGSVYRAIEDLHSAPMMVVRPEDLLKPDCLILPGVGNFSDCAQLLESGGWSGPLRDAVQAHGKPLLGICVGMQLLASFSSEGADAGGEPCPGLALVPGRVDNLRALGCRLRVPHVGWNEVSFDREPADPLFDGIPVRTDFYFVHSYAFRPDDPAHAIASTDYGVAITAAVRSGRIWGTQFHPEKSSRAGFRLLGNFIKAASC